jgi:hypothetical protein
MGGLPTGGISGWINATRVPEIPQVGKPPIGMTIGDKAAAALQTV